MEKKVVTRMAPSPTGNLHIGTTRTALFNYLYARQHGGTFILRIEDTDKERSKKEYEENILEGLAWLGLEHDVLYRQSERGDIYKKFLQQMLDDNKVYISKEDGGERSEVVRFKNPNKDVTFHDEIRGDITFNTTELGDFVIAKSLDEPLYHLAVVVDDFEMGITHIIRGEDGLSNTARQILIQEAINAPRPTYAHIPFILGPDKSKLSKRHGATSLSEFKERGYQKEAIINFIALLGWNPGTDQEIFSLDELIKTFDLTKVQKGGAVFNQDKLDWFNKEYLKNMDPEVCMQELQKRLTEVAPDVLERAKNTLLERISVFDDIIALKESGEIGYLYQEPEYDTEKLLWKNEPDRQKTASRLQNVVTLLDGVTEFTEESVKNAIWDFASQEGRGEVLWPMRYALSGQDRSPDPLELSAILGKEITLQRINYAISKLTQN